MIPTTNLYQYETLYYEKGYSVIAGTDEAGRGPLAGPVVASAVILPKDAKLSLVYDSKKLTEKMRLKALEEIKKVALAIQTVFIFPDEIDEINIYQAAKLAMVKAIEKLEIKPDFVLTDAMPLNETIDHLSIIKGDQKSISIAAASIVAKTTRDAYMKKIAQEYPDYGFEQHKGYGTKKHIAAIKLHGITPIHRKTYEPIKTFIVEGLPHK